MKGIKELEKEIYRINGAGYKAYKDLQGIYNVGDFNFAIDHVQGDPFASPSRVRLIISNDKAQFPRKLFDTEFKRIAMQDYLTRLFDTNLRKNSSRISGSGKSGSIYIARCPQEVLDRTSVIVNDNGIEIRFYAGFPAQGRRVLSSELWKMINNIIIPTAEQTIFFKNININNLEEAIKLSEDQFYIRKEMKKRNIVSFIANGSILPRQSGISQKPLMDALKFEAPKSLEVEFDTPNRGIIKGLGLKKGISIIVGGGYHGKSTLLQAIERGVYNHILGDGREFVLTDDSALKIRAEDGRVITNTDISMFINNLPNKKDTVKFTSENASGSTSQAANVVEGIESGAKVLLIDEDTSATNFMVRDDLMQKLVAKDKEPITPFIEVALDLFEREHISTIMVVGSSGDFFDIAHTVIQMDNYKCLDVTDKAKSLRRGAIIERIQDKRKNGEIRLDININRILGRNFIRATDRGIKVKTRDLDSITLNKEDIDVSYVEQLVDNSQLNLIGAMIKYASENIANNNLTIREIVDKLYEISQTPEGMLKIEGVRNGTGSLAVPRKQEIAAAINRIR